MFSSLHGKCASMTSMRPQEAEASVRPLRLLFLGAKGVGKTSIISRMKEDALKVTDPPKGHSIDLAITEKRDISMWSKLQLSNYDGIVLVYSVKDEPSFKLVGRIIDELIEFENKDDFQSTATVVVANKSDLGHESHVQRVTRDLVVSIDWETAYIEASAKNNDNIDAILRELTRQTEAGRLAEKEEKEKEKADRNESRTADQV